MAKIRTNTYLTEKQKESLEKLSKKTGAPVAELIRRAITVLLCKVCVAFPITVVA